MRSAYQSPPTPPARQFLRRRPEDGREGRERRKGILIVLLLAVAFFTCTFVLSDSGLVRIHALRRENETLRRQKIDLAVRVHGLEQRRQAQARDPLLEERVARERFHLVREGEILYRYEEPDQSSR
jgi:cell division protein FtsB